MPINRNIFRISFLIAVVFTAAVCFFVFPGKEHKSPRASYVKNYVQILFIGDTMFDRGVRYYAQKNGGNDFIFEKIDKVLKDNDLVVANLEGPITGNKSVSSGTIPGSNNNYLFTFDPSWAKTLFDNNIKIVDLGNNHILNFGRDGLAQTKDYLDGAGVGYFGAADYPKSTSTEIGGIKITFVSYNEFSELGAELEQKSVLEEIEKAKGFSDVVIVFCHWGAEYVGPDQAMRNLGRQFIDAGAGLVIGSHSHVIGPMETYKEKRIYYSLGNFIFDQYFSEDVRRSLGIIVKINKKTKEFQFQEKNFYMNSNGQTIEKTYRK